METRGLPVQFATVLPSAEKHVLNIRAGCLAQDSDNSPNLSEHVVEVSVSSFNRQLRVRENPDVNVQRFEIGVLGDASDLKGPVGLCDRANGDLVRVDPLRDWCEPSVGEVDLGRT